MLVNVSQRFNKLHYNNNNNQSILVIFHILPVRDSQCILTAATD